MLFFGVCFFLICILMIQKLLTLSTNIPDLEKLMNSEIANLKIWLEANRLSLKSTKTEFMIIGFRQ